MQYRMKAEDAQDLTRPLDLGLGVRAKLRFDATSAWDMVRTVVNRWQRMSEVERAGEGLRLACDYLVWWNVLSEDDQPVELSPEHIVQVFNQEPGFLVAFISEVADLALEAWKFEKKVSEILRAGTNGQDAAEDTAEVAPSSNSRAHKGKPGTAEPAALT